MLNTCYPCLSYTQCLAYFFPTNLNNSIDPIELNDHHPHTAADSRADHDHQTVAKGTDPDHEVGQRQPEL